MANVVRCLGKYNGAYTRENFTMAKRAIRYLIGTKHLGLVYRPITRSPTLTAFADADHAMCKDSSQFTTGFTLQLNGYNWMWKSKLQRRIPLNTCASKLIAASDCVDNFVWARQLLDELKIGQEVSTLLLR
ncbi:Gag-pol Polyprotein [Phytophthora megakarya]|uniref:Gag-pol Polyprotein n=1 Tax=Phytophthora megakarya TaxID=4795 RepID=A0A225W7Z1_9STRA|nr:Gag-pol Polyprotein [Phytophthora megakarya]